MKLIITIAWRNIQRHRGKSLVIGIILFLGAFIMTVGNGVLSGMDKGLRENIMNRFTGHVVLVAKNQQSDNVLFIPMGRDLLVMNHYKDIKKVLDAQDYIASFIPVARGFTLILNEDGDLGFSLTLGVNFQDYQKFFKNNVLLVEGRLMKNDERGVLVTTGSRRQMYDRQDFWAVPEGMKLNPDTLTPEAKQNIARLNIRHDVVLMGSSSENTTVDVRVPVRGIVKYEYLNDYWENFNILDIESFREAFHYVTAEDAAVEIPQERKQILQAENLEDSLFAGATVVNPADTGAKVYRVENLIGRKVVKKNVDIDAGAYNVVFIKLKDSREIDRDVARINAALEGSGADARAVTWKKATGQLADMATIIRTALFVFVVFIFFVAIIIIMNTLSMAAMERVSELGMMRAVGAQKRFIASMFFSETAFLSFLFGGAGILAGVLCVYVLGLLDITTTNRILELLFGGSVFRPVLDFWDIFTGVIELAAVTVLATIYPIRTARRITPLEAVARD
ncbi:MAG: FtsX-like permease family protein [Spirochaetes bacterium]|nr:MAG: FtsX-like permease family protein [Spirochaetota bacterium]